MRDRGEAPRAVDQPEPGYYALRLTRGGPLVAARIAHEMGQWWAAIDGVHGEARADPAEAPGVFLIWLGAERSDEASYNFRLSTRAWAIANDPGHPAANPYAAINVGAQPSLF